MDHGHALNPTARELIEEVLESGRLWRGNGESWPGVPGGFMVDRLEDHFSQRLTAPFTLALNSGSSANEAAMASLGLDPGDEVICPAASPIFVPLSVLAVGAIPVFADVDPLTLMLTPETVERVVTPKARAVIVVHLWGIPAPIAEIVELSRRLGLKVIEDCAQALDTRVAGRLVGTFGDASCYSFQQSKHISAGEGGMFATSDEDSYKRAVLYSNSGIPSTRHGVKAHIAPSELHVRGHQSYGHNHRMSELQAAVALSSLYDLPTTVRRRAELTVIAKRILTAQAGDRVAFAVEPLGCEISYWRLPFTVPKGAGAYTGISYLEPIFERIQNERLTPFGAPIPDYIDYSAGSCPNAELGASQTSSVSVHQSISNELLLEAVQECIDYMDQRGSLGH